MILRKIRNSFRDLSLNAKMITLPVTFLLIPILAAGGFVFGKVYTNTSAGETKLRLINLANTVDSVDGLLKDYETNIESIYGYEEFFKTEADRQTTFTERNKDGKINRMLADIRNNREFAASMSLIFPDGKSVQSSSGYGGFEEVARENELCLQDMIEQMQGEPAKTRWGASLKERYKKDGSAAFFSCRKVIRNIYEKNQLIGMAVMNVSTTAFNNLTALKGYQENEVLLVADEEGNLVWRSLYSQDQDPIPVEGILQETAGSREKTLTEYRGSGYYFIWQRSAYSGWAFVDLIPYYEVRKQADIFRSFFIWVMILLLLFFIICMILMRRCIVQPIRKLIVIMDDVDELDKIRRNVTVEQRDEIGRLFYTYNCLNERIDQLVERLKDALNQDKEKEIKLLQSQLNPHFIYNTLESISWIAWQKNMPEVSKVVNCLSRILRYSIKDTQEYVTFREELEKLENYIYIQHFRFEDKFEVIYELDDTLLDYRTIKFIFQPFVENALVHGFKDRHENCRIVIRLYETGGDIGIEIEDNGCGMNADQLDRVETSHTQGIGINNINKALQLRFGPAYHLTLQSPAEGGLVVKIRVPEIETGMDDDKHSCY